MDISPSRKVDSLHSRNSRKKTLKDVYGYTSDAVHEEAKSVTGDLSKALEMSASSQERS